MTIILLEHNQMTSNYSTIDVETNNDTVKKFQHCIQYT